MMMPSICRCCTKLVLLCLLLSLLSRGVLCAGACVSECQYESLSSLLDEWLDASPLPTTADELRPAGALPVLSFLDPATPPTAMKYRDQGVPFLLKGVPTLTHTRHLWTPEYLARQFGATRLAVDRSESAYYTWHNVHQAAQEAAYQPPSTKVTMTFEQFYQAAHEHDTRARGASSQSQSELQPPSPFYYLQLSALQAPFLSEDLHTLFSAPSWLVDDSSDPSFRSSANGALQCRFGPPGLISQAHLDMGDNFIAMVAGRKRYVLLPPDECAHLSLRTSGPEARHSALNWLDPAVRNSVAFQQARALRVELGPGDVLYLPSYWIHFIQGQSHSIQCNQRMRRSSIGIDAVHKCGFQPTLPQMAEKSGAPTWSLQAVAPSVAGRHLLQSIDSCPLLSLGDDGADDVVYANCIESDIPDVPAPVISTLTLPPWQSILKNANNWLVTKEAAAISSFTSGLIPLSTATQLAQVANTVLSIYVSAGALGLIGVPLIASGASTVVTGSQFLSGGALAGTFINMVGLDLGILELGGIAVGAQSGGAIGVISTVYNTVNIAASVRTLTHVGGEVVSNLVQTGFTSSANSLLQDLPTDETSANRRLLLAPPTHDASDLNSIGFSLLNLTLSVQQQPDANGTTYVYLNLNNQTIVGWQVDLLFYTYPASNSSHANWQRIPRSAIDPSVLANLSLPFNLSLSLNITLDPSSLQVVNPPACSAQTPAAAGGACPLGQTCDDSGVCSGGGGNGVDVPNTAGQERTAVVSSGILLCTLAALLAIAALAAPA